MEVLKPAKVETTYRHKETGELFKEKKDWEAKGYKNEDMAQDVNVIMPSLDLFGKTKQNSKMAITNAQQYQQLVNKPANGKRPGYRGQHAYGDKSGSEQARSFSKATSRSGTFGGAPTQTREEKAGRTQGDAFRRSKEAFNTGVGITDLERLKNEGVPKLNAPSFLSAALNFAKPLRDKVLEKNIKRYERTTTGPYTLQGYKDYMKSMRDRFTPDDDDNDSDPIFIPQDMMAEAPSIIDQEPIVEEPFEISRRFAAEGGIMNSDVVGGEMDFDSARQMYGLGKLVKKITRSVKKVAKSPIGKAALLATPFLMNPAARSGLASFLFKSPMAKGSGFGGFMEMLKGGMTGGGKFALGAGLTLAPFLAGDQEEEEPMYAGADLPNPVNYYLSGKYRPNERLAADGGLMRLNYQEGGDAEPVAKKTMPLLDMDGQEMDLREEGGFVPLGRMERADDVPARLSKNEFVFTADAVRNAGEGDVDKGAEVMYNMMKNLESGGEVSEESQGLEGAREMFQTSQRLEEVI